MIILRHDKHCLLQQHAASTTTKAQGMLNVHMQQQSLVLSFSTMIPISHCGLQGFYVSLVYHGISIAYGGDSAIQDKDTWITDWVSLVKQVLKSDACEVSLHARCQRKIHLLFCQMLLASYSSPSSEIWSRHKFIGAQADRSTIARAI